jgi:lactoylglutathione lyase
VRLRAFPVIYAVDAGFIRLRRHDAELAVTTEASPRMLAGVEPGPGPRHEMFVYVEDLDAALAAVREEQATVLRDPADMPWGERLAFVRDPEGNLVTLAAASG